MTAIATVRALVYAQVPEAPDLLIDRVLIETARDFCKQTRAWRSTITETVTADTLTVDVTPPTEGELVDVVTASLDSQPLEKKTEFQLDEIDPDWRTVAGTPFAILLGDDTDQVIVAGLSSTTYTAGLTIRAAWQPILGAATLDGKLVSQFSDALVRGALGRLYLMPDQPWTSENKAGFYMTWYENDVNDAKSKVADGGMIGVGRKVRYGGL